jgi:integrase
MAPEVCMVRIAAARKFGISAKRIKEPFLGFQLVDFAALYGNQHQGYCHLVVLTMAILSFDTLYRYSDVSRLKWKNIKFESDSSSFEITFEIRKSAQFRQGNKVIVSAIKQEVCPL